MSIKKDTNVKILDDGTCICPKCGSSKRFKFNSHMDGSIMWINNYQCADCGEYIFFKCTHHEVFDIKFIEL